MNIKIVRSIHLYSGCFLMPLLVFFLLTGLLQTFNLHRPKKAEGYKPWAIVAAASQVHKNQRFATESFSPPPSKIFQALVVVMTIGLLLNLIMGIVLAFKFGHAPVVWVSLVLGILVPVAVLYWPWLHKTAG